MQVLVTVAVRLVSQAHFTLFVHFFNFVLKQRFTTMVDKPRPWLTIAMRGEGIFLRVLNLCLFNFKGQFENMSEVTARRQAEIAFLTGLHHRCGSMRYGFLCLRVFNSIVSCRHYLLMLPGGY